MPRTEAWLKGQHVEAPRQMFHHILHLFEHPHATRPSLDMLAECTERFELDEAVQLWAPVYLLFVDRAFQVLIEAREGGKHGVAYEAFVRVRLPIPGELCRPRRRARSFVPFGPTNQPVGVRYNAVSVRTHDPVVDLFARHARRALAMLKVEHECCNSNERPIAAASRAHDDARLVLLGVKMLLEVVLILETPAALGTVIVDLVVVCLEFRIAVK